MQPQQDNKNMILFVVLTAVILIGYNFFVLAPEAKRKSALKAQAVAAQQEQAQRNAVLGAPPAVAVKSRAQALASTARITIDTPALKGSIALNGARIDDLQLKQYRQTVDKNSPPVELFEPYGAKYAYFSQSGWLNALGQAAIDQGAAWRPVGNTVLKPGQDVVLAFDTVEGLSFRRQISVDDQYMFTIKDTVANLSPRPVTLAPYASVQRHGLPAELGKNPIIHEGAIGHTTKNVFVKYKDWAKKADVTQASTGGWFGVTDKYWLAALIPSQAEKVNSTFRVTTDGDTKIFEASYVGQAREIGPGRQIVETSRLFAGAKRAEVLKTYEEKFGIPQFDQAIDWGMFWFFTRPFFKALEAIFHVVGNFGIAILILTVIVKLLFFPLANQSYASMSKMKKLQPKVEELKKKYANDQAKQQQEMMALYQREKINPLAGCLPLLVQIPVFFALYKTLFVTIEMRHAPFYGWIHDLSAPDPTTLFNLFGLIPWDPSGVPLIGKFLLIGVWPLLYGVTMWLQQAMSPASPDPTQQALMKWFPVVFTVLLAQSPAGLVIYWTWSNVLTIGQQYLIMRRYDVENPIDDIIGKLTGKGAKAKAG